jgi:hypothetical protein
VPVLGSVDANVLLFICSFIKLKVSLSSSKFFFKS